MATFIFDGTQSVVASKTDTVVISATPSLFTNVADSGSNVVFSYSNGTSLTITGTNFGTNANFPNVSLSSGDFVTSAGVTGSKANALVFAPGSTTTAATVDLSAGGAAGGVKAVFGGLGTADPSDGPDSIVVGGKGSFLVYGNAGNDSITQTGAFDSSSFVTVFGGKGNDSIDLNVAGNAGAHIAVYGSENGTGGVDSISVINTGTGSSTTIFGGVGAADPNDGADFIRFSGGGTVNIYANAGNDTVNLNAGIDSTGNVTVHLGIGSDSVSLNTNAGAKATIAVYGDEGTDTIGVTTGVGTAVVYGDTAAADPNGGADSITMNTAGTTTVYAAGGNDTVILQGATTGATSTDVVTVYGGNGTDSISITSGYASATSGAISMILGAGSDTVNVAFNGAKGNTYSIEDFVPTTGGDKLIITIAGGTQTQPTIIQGSFQTLQQALDAAAQGVTASSRIAAVVYSGSTYVVGNDTNAGFDSTTDVAVKLTGVTDLGSVATSVSGA